MNEEQAKKYRAAIAGVMMFLEEECAKNANQIERPPVTEASNWALYGRQSIMNNRSMCQMRIKTR